VTQRDEFAVAFCRRRFRNRCNQPIGFRSDLGQSPLLCRRLRPPLRRTVVGVYVVGIMLPEREHQPDVPLRHLVHRHRVPRLRVQPGGRASCDEAARAAADAAATLAPACALRRTGRSGRLPPTCRTSDGSLSDCRRLPRVTRTNAVAGLADGPRRNRVASGWPPSCASRKRAPGGASGRSRAFHLSPATPAACCRKPATITERRWVRE
jgi:hypothetical protein